MQKLKKATIRGAAHQARFEISSGLSIVAFDDINQASHYGPPITTIRQSPASLGEIGSAKLLERLDEGRTEPASFSMGISLAVRPSPAPPP